MGTPFSTIEDLAMVTIQDYKLDALYQSSPTDWATFVGGFVVRASLLFGNSAIDLSYDISTLSFNNTLGAQETNILVYLFIQMWLERSAQNLSQKMATMTPSDAKRTNLPTTLKEQQYALDAIREKTSQLMTEYSYDHVDWNAWLGGNFIPSSGG